MWYLIIPIPDLCTLTYFSVNIKKNIQYLGQGFGWKNIFKPPVGSTAVSSKDMVLLLLIHGLCIVTPIAGWDFIFEPCF